MMTPPNASFCTCFPWTRVLLTATNSTTWNFSFIEGKDWYVGESCVVSRELPDYAIASIRTGQYSASGSRHVWIGEYTFSPSK